MAFAISLGEWGWDPTYITPSTHYIPELYAYAYDPPAFSHII